MALAAAPVQAQNFIGTWGNDTFNGTSGNDFMMGSYGHDRLYGHDGHDWIMGEHDNDTLTGGWGNDSIQGGYGRDNIYGGGGNDVLHADNDGEKDWHTSGEFIDGGTGYDKCWAFKGDQFFPKDIVVNCEEVYYFHRFTHG